MCEKLYRLVAWLFEKAKTFRKSKTVEIYVNLPDEGTPTCRPTQAIPMSNGLYKILPTPDYDPEDEIWEFLPNSIVRCELRQAKKSGMVLLAVEQVAINFV